MVHRLHHRQHLFGCLLLAGLVFDSHTLGEEVVGSECLLSLLAGDGVVDSCDDGSGPMCGPLLAVSMSFRQGVKLTKSKPPELLIGEMKVIDSDCP